MRVSAVTLVKWLRLHRAYHYVMIMLAVAAAFVAIGLVTSLTVDLGPAARAAAEKAGSDAWKRPIHIGTLSIRLFGGRVLVDDFLIEGLKPGDRPFFTAKHLEVSLDWSTLLQWDHPLRPEITITAVDMTDWEMLAEKWENQSNFPKFTSDDDSPKGPKRFTTTLKYLRAGRGQFTFEDHEAPWSIVARNIDIRIGNLPQYHGTATFTDGTVAIQNHVPFSASMKASYVIDGGLIHLDHIDFETDGAKTTASGDVDMAHWPEQQYDFISRVQFPRMRQLFFTDEKWELAGEGEVVGRFHLFKGGRDLSGTFSSAMLGVNQYRFPALGGKLQWTNHLFEVREGHAKLFGGDGRFAYSIAPLGEPAPAIAKFSTDFSGVDLAAFTDFQELRGLKFAGAVSGDQVVLEWPLGKFSEHRGGGHLSVTPPGGVTPMGASLADWRVADAGHALHEWGPFAPTPFPSHLPVAADLTYRFDPDQVYIDEGRFATERTHTTLQGTTAWGDQSRLAFHVTSRDWQESDQLLAGIMSDFGAPRNPVTFGGRGEFDGVMTGAFRTPRVEGEFSGEDLRGFDTLWGASTAHLVVENDYVRVTDGIVTATSQGGPDSEMRFDGLFSLGFPRDDGGDEIDARIRVTRRDVESLRHAFGIDEYPVSGSLSGEFQVTGRYLRPVGFGRMTLERFEAYGEPFPSATAALRFDGTGVRLDNLTVEKAGGTISGAAYVGWDATYSFNVDGRRIPVESLTRLKFPRAPLTGLAEFSANGGATFDQPRNDYRFRVNDLFIGDEGIGQVTATLGLRGTDLTGEVNAASPRLAITATGRVDMTPKGASELAIRFHDVSLDPYLRPFVPSLSPFATAVAGGAIRVTGRLTDPDRLVVDGTVETLNMRLFDYELKNAAPIRLSLDDRQVKIDEVRFEGEDTHLRLGGRIDLRGQGLSLQANGDANLAVLQGFFHDVRGSGRADLTAAVDGPWREPVFSGRATITNGRVRHFSLPTSLDAINGVLSFDSAGIRLDELTAMMGGGRVQFGGRIGFVGYEPGELNVTMRGEGVQLRVPEGVRSVVDPDLTLRGSVKAPTLGGSVVVKDATYTKAIDAPETILEFAVRRPFEAGGGAGSGPDASTSVPSTIPLRYDIEVSVPSTLRIDNNLARGVASADLTLRGTYDHPVFFGHAQVERGELSYKGKRYRLIKGTVDFTNPSRIEPFFDVEAETNVRSAGQNYRLTVGVTGPTQKLAAALTSEPFLPAADVLALLFSDVRRTDDVELSTLRNPTQRQNDLLSASAAETIAKPISDAGKLVQRTIGVDTFQLTPFLTDLNSTQASRLNPTARLTIGKRISDRVYLTFSRSLASSINDQIILLEYEASERASWIFSRNEDSQTYALELRVRRTF